MVKTDQKTADGLTIYNVIPEDTQLWLIAGPDVDAESIEIDDVDNLPSGFRWLSEDETERFANGNYSNRVGRVSQLAKHAGLEAV